MPEFKRFFLAEVFLKLNHLSSSTLPYRSLDDEDVVDDEDDENHDDNKDDEYDEDDEVERVEYWNIVKV